MADPVSLAMLTGFALTEGIKFLYNQAGALLESWRQRRLQAGTGAGENGAPVLPPLEQAEVLDGPPDPSRRPDPNLVEARLTDLESALDALDPYVRARAARQAQPDDLALRTDVERLRGLLEELYGQRLTFKGEGDGRGRTGTVLDVRVQVVDVADSEVTGITNAGAAAPGSRVVADVRAERVQGSVVKGVSYS